MGFKIIRDFIKEKDETGAVGTESMPPKHFFQMYIGVDDPSQYEYKGGKIKVRLLDDDGGIYYHALVDDDDFSCELLLDWGGSYAGCVSMDMHIDNYKEIYGEDVATNPRHERSKRKDGKWFSYMG